MMVDGTKVLYISISLIRGEIVEKFLHITKTPPGNH